jgi:hypothetical protein
LNGVMNDHSLQPAQSARAERPNGRRRRCGEAKAGECRPPGV